MADTSKKFEDFEPGTPFYLNVKGNIQNEVTGLTTVREISLKSFILSRDKIPALIAEKIPKEFQICSDIKVDGYLITFDSTNNIETTMVVSEGSNNYKFRKVIVRTLVLGDRKFLIVGSREKGLKFNLRNAFRVRLDSYATVAILPSMVQRECSLRDLSSTGLGIEVDSKYDIEVGRELEIQFRFESKDFGSLVTLYTVRAKVLRIVSLSDENNLVGCTITESDKKIDKLIMMKQRDEVNKLIK